MVYGKKKTSKSRKTMSKKNYKKPSMAIQRAVKQVLHKAVETKATITSITESAINTLISPVASNSITLNSLANGTGQQNRVGVKVNARYMDIRGCVIFPTDAPAIYTKIFLLMHNQEEDPINDLLETNAAVFGAAGNDISATYARVNTTKYRVLATRMIKTGNTAGLQQTMPFKINCSLRNQVITFENNSGNTTPSNKRITLHYYSRRADNDDTLGTNGEINWNAKFYFQDL